MRKRSLRRVRWRWIRNRIGLGLMFLGAAIAIAFTALAAIVIGNFLEWENARDAFTTLGMIWGPAIGVAILFLVSGRALYGGRDAGTPLRDGASWLLQACGGTAGAVAGVAMIFFILSGVSPDERLAVIKLAVAVIVSLSIAGIGWLMRRPEATS